MSLSKSSKMFTLSSDHLKLLERMRVDWIDCEYGAPCIDPKRPYGNGDVERDIAGILGWKLVETRNETDLSPEQSKQAERTHKEMEIVLQIALIHIRTGVRAGVYTRPYDFGDDWSFVHP